MLEAIFMCVMAQAAYLNAQLTSIAIQSTGTHGYGTAVSEPIPISEPSEVTASNDSGVPGSKDPSNVDFLDAQHRHGGIVFPEMWGASGDGKVSFHACAHDDASSIQKCVDYSSSNHARCELLPMHKYCVQNTVRFSTGAWLEGTGLVNATQIACEVNGDCFAIASGPVQSLTLAGFQVSADPALPKSVGLNATAVATLTGGIMQGGLWDSHLQYVEFDGCALQCLKLYGGGGAGYAYNAPNQFIELYHVVVNGPAQPHPTPLVDIRGQVGQIAFIGGAVNGDRPNSPNYPSLVDVVNLTERFNDAPVDVEFDNYTVQNGQIGLRGAFARALSWNAGWIENVGTPARVADIAHLNLSNIHVANSGTFGGIVQAMGGVRGTISNLDIQFDSGHAPYKNLLGNCGGNNNHLEFYGSSDGLNTNGCVTTQINPAHTVTLVSDTAIVNGDDCEEPIQTLNTETPAGHLVTLTNWSGTRTFCIAPGGNVSFGNTPAPFVVAPRQTIQLLRVDLGSSLTLLDPMPPGVTLQESGADQYSQEGIFPTTVEGNRGCIGSRYGLRNQAAGSPNAQYNSVAICPQNTGMFPLFFTSGPAAIGGESWTQVFATFQGTTGRIGGSPLLEGQCLSDTLGITGVNTSMVVYATPVTYPGDGFRWPAYISSPGLVTVKVCAAKDGTPVPTRYNVRVLQ